MSPSLMGCLYLFGGFLGVAAGMAFITSLVLGIWDLLPRLRMRTIHVAQAAFLLVVLTEANDGDLSTTAKQMLFAAAVPDICRSSCRSPHRICELARL